MRVKIAFYLTLIFLNYTCKNSEKKPICIKMQFWGIDQSASSILITDLSNNELKGKYNISLDDISSWDTLSVQLSSEYFYTFEKILNQTKYIDRRNPSNSISNSYLILKYYSATDSIGNFYGLNESINLIQSLNSVKFLSNGNVIDSISYNNLKETDATLKYIKERYKYLDSTNRK